MTSFLVNHIQTIPQLYRAVRIWEPQQPDFDIHRYETAAPHMQGVRLGTFRCQFYQLSLLEEGTTTLQAGLRHWEASSATLILTGPDHLQTWTGAKRTQPLTGYILFFTPEWLADAMPHTSLRHYFPLFGPDAQLVIKLPPEQLPIIQDLYGRILYEANSEATDRFAVIKRYLYILLVHINRICADQRPTIRPVLSAAHQLVQRLEQLIDQTITQHPTGTLLTVRACAALLNVHPYYLNRVVRQVTGQPVSALIASRLMTEAKTLLLHSPATVSEIGYWLGFRDPSHFVRFFRKQAGQSPNGFRIAHLV